MAKTRRVVFSFDERSLESLEKLAEQGRVSSMTEVVVRNPGTNEERVLVIPKLQASGQPEKERR